MLRFINSFLFHTELMKLFFFSRRDLDGITLFDLFALGSINHFVFQIVPVINYSVLFKYSYFKC